MPSGGGHIITADPSLPVLTADPSIAGSNQIDREPRRLSEALWLDRFVLRERKVSGIGMRLTRPYGFRN